MSVTTFEEKCEFLRKMSNRIRASYNDMIESPMSISSDIRTRWAEEADRANQMFDEIIRFFETQATNCFECNHELDGPSCPKCSKET
jgi:hypothetical protein